MKRIALFFALIVLLSTLAGCAAKQVTGDDVVKAFKDAGLEAENPSAMAAKDYGMAPYLCKGTHFFVPSIDSTAGGRVLVCDNDKDRDALSGYYTELGKQSALLFSWVFVKGNVVVQINGDLPEETAKKYEAAIP